MSSNLPQPNLFDNGEDTTPTTKSVVDAGGLDFDPVAQAALSKHAKAEATLVKKNDATKNAISSVNQDYDASAIEVLEGLEPVRKRPGMYIGGTDEKAMHHLFAEVLDNAMDEAVAGHAKAIWVELDSEGYLSVRDDGRGIPVDPHPKYPGKSALEVVLTILHSGGKFSGKAYETSGGLHGVGVSVVNALSQRLDVTVWRDGFEWRQSFSKGLVLGPIERGNPTKKRGTLTRFLPDDEIFGIGCHFRAARLYRMSKAKAYLFRGVQIFWKCDQSQITDQTPNEDKFYFPNGLADYLAERISSTQTLCEIFSGRVDRKSDAGAVEWAVVWSAAGFGEYDGFVQSYCNTIPTQDGGTHEAGLRSALTRSLKSYAEMTGDKRGTIITAEDVAANAGIVISVFIKNPEFQGQTKDRLSSSDAQKLVENALRDPFDHWLTSSPKQADKILQFIIERAEDRLKRRKDKEVQRASATRKLRLPGKLSDCSRQDAIGTELFIVEGDSAGGSAKQARNRNTQAILPLRGKILNVATATGDKARANQELLDLGLALGVQPGTRFKEEDLRYQRIIIMTDADVDGAHIASLLITYFYRTMPALVRNGNLYLAMPPLFRISHGAKTVYARDETHRNELIEKEFKNKKPEIGRFKGLGEMMPAQLKVTTMDPKTRTLARVTLPDDESEVQDLVETLMGRKPELRFKFIQENAEFVTDDLDV